METAKEKARRKILKDNFNLTPEDWQIISNYQAGVCFICHKKQKSGKRLATDHCHLTGKIRGILCSTCNRLLGKVERIWTIQMLLLVIEYLQNSPATKALGRTVYGFAGRCGTRRHRAEIRRKAKQAAKELMPPSEQQVEAR